MNMQKLMAQAQKMQKDITAKKEQIDKEEFKANNEFVEVILYGTKKIKSVKILKNDLKVDDYEVLEDMIVLIINEIIEKINKKTETELGQYNQYLNGMM